MVYFNRVSASLIGLAFILGLAACAGGGTITPSQAGPVSQDGGKHGQCGQPLARVANARTPDIAICGTPTPPPPPFQFTDPCAQEGTCDPTCITAATDCGESTVGWRNPQEGQNCMDSTLTLGDSMPANLAGRQYEVVDILPIIAVNSTGARDVLAWEYVTHAGNWMEENKAFNAFWSTTVVNSGIPILSGLAAALSGGGFVQTNSSQWNAVENYMSNHNGYVGRCFSRELTV